ncbi:MAG: DUF1499 domain-containing protein [Gemmatimonadales bacterium]
MPPALPLALRLLGYGLLLFVISGPLHRFGGFHYRLAMLVLVVGVGLLAAGLVTGGVAVAASLRAGTGVPWAAALLGLAALVPLGMVASMIVTGFRVPVIHDITTDTDDPPAFVALLPLREGAESPAEYDGPEAARLQLEGYPALAPLRTAQPPAEVLPAAAEVADELGWTVQVVAPAEGRLEALATTKWFGFTDDVVVRVRPDGSGSVVDIRSKSRVGRSDLGANAARIRKFLAALAARLER